MTPLPFVQVAIALLALSIPLLFALSALLPAKSGQPFHSASHASHASGALALLVALAFALQNTTPTLPYRWPVAVDALARTVLLDPASVIMLLLVCSLGLVIVRYSRSYLRDEPGQPRYVRALLTTLGAVTLLVIANNLLVITLAWLTTSLALHQLLTFYRERRLAVIAAHKKFLLSRLADICLFGAMVLIAQQTGSLSLDRVNAWQSSDGSLTQPLQLAAVMLVLGVALKSAQLPFHGWLTQVMEAPTPVSALLHAGVVNIGGFVMIRLAPFMSKAPIAQALLVTIGMTTALLASLIMTTRVSIKVALAWSTCAQMGLMLVQCGLGAPQLALLHLVAHSLYKAHAFLSAGSAVERWRAQALCGRPEPVSMARTLAATVLGLTCSLLVMAAATLLFDASEERLATLLPLGLVTGVSLAPFLARGLASGPVAVVGLLLSLGVVALTLLWHAAFESLLAAPAPAMPGGLSVLAAGLLMLFLLQSVLQARPEGWLARTVQPWLFAGLYLDELFTRMTFRIWPARLSSASETTVHRRNPAALEAQS